jgi:hypothetical protein
MMATDCPMVVPAAIVLLNYAAQIPYAWYLYGLRVSPTGAGLLLLTLVWFVVGLALLRVTGGALQSLHRYGKLRSRVQVVG